MPIPQHRFDELALDFVGTIPVSNGFDTILVMTDRLTLGYRDGVALSDSWLGPVGTRVTGHEFHRTVVTPTAGAAPAWRWAGGDPEGFVVRSAGRPGGVHASYLHLHWAGQPAIARRLVAACA